MKRVLIVLTMILSATAGIMADPVSPAAAGAAAARFLTGGARTSSSATAAVSRVDMAIDDPEPTYYVFRRDNGCGFVIIAGDDRMPQIVGYSYTNPFDADAIPPGLTAFFSDYTAAVDAVRSGTAIPATDTPGGETIGPLMSVEWNQTDPYNRKCPRIGIFRAPTGCVATAMAQVLKYHAHPANGFGTVTDNNVEYDLSESVYDWSMMPDQYIRGEYTTNQANQVAQLMVDCGHAVHMEYGSEESGALTEYVAPALVKNFGYDSGIQYQMRSAWTDNGWIRLLRANLAEGLPVIYGGNGAAGGHQFICDGIDTDDRLHINWGWGGMSDGFYDMNALEPDDVGTGGSSITFNNNQDIVCWIRPRDTTVNGLASWQPHLALGNMKINTKTDADGRYQTSSSAISVSFEIDNATGGLIRFNYGYVLYDAKGNEVSQVINHSGSFSGAGYYLPNATLSISTKDLQFGKYHAAWRWQNATAGAADSGLQEFWTGDLAEGIWFEIKAGGCYKTEPEESGIAGVTATAEWQLTTAGSDLILSGAPDGSHIRVYTLAGVLTATSTVCADTAAISMAGAPSGIYIVQVAAPDGLCRVFKAVLHN